MVGCRRPSSTGWPGSVTSMASPSLLESSCCLSASSLSESAPSSRFLALFAADPASRLSSTGSELTPRSSWVSDPFLPRYETRHCSSASGSANGSSSERALEVSSSTCCIMVIYK